MPRVPVNKLSINISWCVYLAKPNFSSVTANNPIRFTNVVQQIQILLIAVQCERPWPWKISKSMKTLILMFKHINISLHESVTIFLYIVFIIELINGTCQKYVSLMSIDWFLYLLIYLSPCSHLLQIAPDLMLLIDDWLHNQ